MRGLAGARAGSIIGRVSCATLGQVWKRRNPHRIIYLTATRHHGIFTKLRFFQRRHSWFGGSVCVRHLSMRMPSSRRQVSVPRRRRALKSAAGF